MAVLLYIIAHEGKYPTTYRRLVHSLFIGQQLEEGTTSLTCLWKCIMLTHKLR